MSSSRGLDDLFNSQWQTRGPVGQISRSNKGSKTPKTDKPSQKVVRLQSQNYEQVKKACLEQGALWEDPDFPANNRSLFYSQNPPGRIQWKRPGELTSKPQMFVDGYNRFDIVQGELGNCWLLAAVSSLCATRNDKMFHRVVPQDNSFSKEYTGVFHFRFWQYGKWVEVVIDDQLPTLNGQLCYVHSSDNNEFWSALLEKAYAKLNGSYEALCGGCSAEAMEDFTGGVSEIYDFRKEVPRDLHKTIIKAFERDSLLGCTIHADSGQIEDVLPTGLIVGHAYSITDVKQISAYGRQVDLVRIRNPWGNHDEWNGAWSDRSQEWNGLSETLRRDLGISYDDDGEFWMSIDDFVNNFDKMEICNLSAGSLCEPVVQGKRRWEVNVEDGSWRSRVNAGGCRKYLDTFWTNPQYRIEITDPDDQDDENTGTLLVALMQKESRKRKSTMGDDVLLTMGYMIYKLQQPDCGPLDLNFFKYNQSAGKTVYTNMRSVVGRHKLIPGHYVVLPCTFKPNIDGDFLLRLFTEKACTMNEMDETTGIVHPPPEAEMDQKYRRVASVTQEDVEREKYIRKLFKDTSGPDLEVDGFELRHILNTIYKKDVVLREGFSLEAARSIVAMKDVDHSGKLNYAEFKKMWKSLRKWQKSFNEFDQDRSGTFNSYELRGALNAAGFRVSNATFNCLVMRYSDQQGRIYFDDFILCAVRMRTMMNTFSEVGMGGKSANFSLDEFIQTTMYS